MGVESFHRERERDERRRAKAAKREARRAGRRDILPAVELPAELHTFGYAHPDAEPAS